MFDSLCYSRKSFDFVKKFLDKDKDHNFGSFIFELLVGAWDSIKYGSGDIEDTKRTIKPFFRELYPIDIEMKMGYDFDYIRKYVELLFIIYIEKKALFDPSGEYTNYSIKNEMNQDFIFSTLSSTMIYSPFLCSGRMNSVNFYRDTNIEAINIQNTDHL